MRRECPRTLDKPILLFGLELEDLGILTLIIGIGSLLFGPMIPGFIGAAGWFALLRFKSDKSSGYMLHWLYAQGIDLPGLIHPINKVKQYGVYGTYRIKKFSIY